jgi:hypothetical protein
MGKNEIRLRRHRMSSGRIAQHRNYGDIMARLERDVKLKRVTQFFTYILVIIILILLFVAFILIRRWEKNPPPKEKTSTAYVVDDSDFSGA